MSENQYRILGWGVLLTAIAVSLSWCVKETGLAGSLMDFSVRIFKVRLKQGSCFVSFIILVLPAYILKRYCEEFAWNAHVKALPPPDIRESAKKSKYIDVQTPVAAAPPKPIEVSALPKDQEEFIATCGACGHFFSARKDLKTLQCPNCGESIPIKT